MKYEKRISEIDLNWRRDPGLYSEPFKFVWTIYIYLNYKKISATTPTSLLTFVIYLCLC